MFVEAVFLSLRLVSPIQYRTFDTVNCKCNALTVGA